MTFNTFPYFLKTELALMCVYTDKTNLRVIRRLLGGRQGEGGLFRLSDVISCRDNLLISSVEMFCLDYLLRLYVVIICCDYLL